VEADVRLVPAQATNRVPAPSSALFHGSSAPCTGAGGNRMPGISGIGYSLRVRGLLGAGSRSALPLRFSVIFEYGGLIP
jgi:hypothetical protein